MDAIVRARNPWQQTQTIRTRVSLKLQSPPLSPAREPQSLRKSGGEGFHQGFLVEERVHLR